MLDPTSTTRDRILDEALSLFADRGFRGTSVAEIESASGLAPGSGALYHHFPSKEALLAEAVSRQLTRLDALRRIRSVFDGVGDLRSQLSITARYLLAELDDQAHLLRLVASEARRGSELLGDAVERLVSESRAGLAGWLEGAGASRDRARSAAELGYGALFASRVNRDVIGAPSAVDDDTLIATWIEMMMGALSR